MTTLSDRARVALVTGTRAEFGLLEKTIAGLRDEPGVELELIAAGMHLSERHGASIREVEARFAVAARVEMRPADDSPAGMGAAVARGLGSFLDLWRESAPDLLIVLGDRTEVFAAALAAAYLRIPIAHIHGGDTSGNAIDDFQRDAISRLAAINFAATATSAARLEGMTVPGAVHVVGAPGLDSIYEREPCEPEALAAQLGIGASAWLVVLYHPLPERAPDAAREMREVLDAAEELARRLEIGVVAIYPNNDAGHEAVVYEIESRAAGGRVTAFRNLAREDYLDLLEHATILIGNSSSGIIESAALGLPVVNVGERQRGRERDENVVDAPARSTDIVRAGVDALDSRRVGEIVSSRESLYGDGGASDRIVRVVLEWLESHATRSDRSGARDPARRAPRDPIAVIGAGGHGKVALEALVARGERLRLLDRSKRVAGTRVLGIEVELESTVLAELAGLESSTRFFVAAGDSRSRQATAARWSERGHELVAVIHPSAVVSASARIAPGACVMAGAVVQAGASVGAGAIVNTGATIDHDCIVGDWAHVAPGANLAGAVVVGAHAWVGIGACVRESIAIGKGSTVGAGAVVVEDVPGGVVAFGNPCRVRDEVAAR